MYMYLITLFPFVAYTRKMSSNPLYLHFRSNPLMNLKIFATVRSLMNYANKIDSCQAHLPVQYSSNIELIGQK